VSLTAAGGQNIVISVKDSGTGFDEATLPRLLEPFTKDDWHTPGAGLGLHITQKLVQSLGGRLSLKSEIGKGTIFEVTAPYRLEDHDIGSSKPIRRETLKMISPITSPSVPIAGVAKLASNVPTIRVLVVDDNILCRRLLVKGLKRGETPVETCEAPDGQAALDRFPAFNPDLVLTDVSMPIMDGITSAELMRKVSAERNMEQCKIYAITGLGSMDPRLKKVALNGTAALDGWLVKGKDDLKAISRIVADVYSSRVRAQ
jgi:CheY-like chemotaxis protein